RRAARVPQIATGVRDRAHRDQAEPAQRLYAPLWPRPGPPRPVLEPLRRTADEGAPAAEVLRLLLHRNDDGHRARPRGAVARLRSLRADPARRIVGRARSTGAFCRAPGHLAQSLRPGGLTPPLPGRGYPLV